MAVTTAGRKNHSRLHFGLGTNTSVDIEIRWPSGTIDTHTISNVNTVYKAIENGALVELDFGGSSDPEADLTSWSVISGGISVVGNRVEYSGTPTGWNANTATSVPLSDLGYNDNYAVNFEIDQVPGPAVYVIGLGVAEVVAGWRDVDYAFRVANGTLRIYENGQYVTTVGAVDIGDVLSISIEGSTLSYQLNGNTLLTRNRRDSVGFLCGLCIQGVFIRIASHRDRHARSG